MTDNFTRKRVRRALATLLEQEFNPPDGLVQVLTDHETPQLEGQSPFVQVMVDGSRYATRYGFNVDREAEFSNDVRLRVAVWVRWPSDDDLESGDYKQGDVDDLLDEIAEGLLAVVSRNSVYSDGSGEVWKSIRYDDAFSDVVLLLVSGIAYTREAFPLIAKVA